MSSMITFSDYYRILWIEKVNGGQIGYVNNYTTDFEGVRRIHIEKNINLQKETNHRMLAFAYTMDGPKIFVSNDFLALPKLNREVLIWHEVGHVHHHHYTELPSDFNHMNYRIGFVNNNSVAPEEIAADLFILSKIRKKIILETLQIQIETRHKLIEEFNFGLKELILRKHIMEKQIVTRSFYFAYGSNLLLKQMTIRCPECEVYGIGRLDGYKWIINSRGYANIIKSSNDFVLGTVYSITKADEYSLDTFEGVSSKCYEKFILQIRVDNSEIPCLVYVDPKTDVGTPNFEYIKRLNKGFIDAKLPNEYYKKYWESFLK